jgi:hypothetical protein
MAKRFEVIEYFTVKHSGLNLLFKLIDCIAKEGYRCFRRLNNSVVGGYPGYDRPVINTSS